MFLYVQHEPGEPWDRVAAEYGDDPLAKLVVASVQLFRGKPAEIRDTEGAVLLSINADACRHSADPEEEPSTLVAEAEAAGAKIARQADGFYALLDMPGTAMWHAVFRSADAAAEAYLAHQRAMFAPASTAPARAAAPIWSAPAGAPDEAAGAEGDEDDDLDFDREIAADTAARMTRLVESIGARGPDGGGRPRDARWHDVRYLLAVAGGQLGVGAMIAEDGKPSSASLKGMRDYHAFLQAMRSGVDALDEALLRAMAILDESAPTEPFRRAMTLRRAIHPLPPTPEMPYGRPAILHEGLLYEIETLFDVREAAMQPGRKIGPDEIATAGICAHTLTRALAEMASGMSVALGGRP